MRIKANCAAMLAVAAAVAPIEAPAAVDVFLRIPDVEGESLDEVHRGAIDVFSWSWGLTKVIGEKGISPVFNNLHLVKPLDKASPVLMDACAQAKTFDRAVLILRSQGIAEVEFARVVMEEVNISGILIGLSVAPDALSESVAISYGRVGIEYFTILPNGAPGERFSFAWDLVNNREGGVTFPGGPYDSDNDGMPDEWERQFGLDLNANDANLDRDQDGATNYEEFVAGTSPVSANQVFRSTLALRAGSQTAQLSWVSAAGKTYRILVGDRLGAAFQEHSIVQSAGDGTTTVNLPATSGNRFYRVQVVE